MYISRILEELLKDEKEGSCIAMNVGCVVDEGKIKYHVAVEGWIDPYGPKRRFYNGRYTAESFQEAQEMALLHALNGRFTP